MNNLRKDVRELISLNERLQSALLRGIQITEDEAILIRQCATELLEKIPSSSRTWMAGNRSLDGQASGKADGQDSGRPDGPS